MATEQSTGSESVWIFIGLNARYPAGVFRKFSDAEHWVIRNGLSGILSLYPLDQGVLEWAIEAGWFNPRHEIEIDADYISRFSSAYQAHHQYEKGRRIS